MICVCDLFLGRVFLARAREALASESKKNKKNKDKTNLVTRVADDETFVSDSWTVSLIKTMRQTKELREEYHHVPSSLSFTPKEFFISVNLERRKQAHDDIIFHS